MNRLVTLGQVGGACSTTPFFLTVRSLKRAHCFAFNIIILIYQKSFFFLGLL